MWWLIAIVVLIAAFAVPRFGKFLLATIALMLVVGGSCLFVLNERQERERKAALIRIRPHEVELADFRLTPGAVTGLYTLAGRVRNRSARRIAAASTRGRRDA